MILPEAVSLKIDVSVSDQGELAASSSFTTALAYQLAKKNRPKKLYNTDETVREG